MQRDREKNDNNKALVYEDSSPLVQIFFSDVSKITEFQSLNPFTQKSNDDCFKIAEKSSLCRIKNKHKIRDFLSFHQIMWTKGFVFLV